MCTCHPEHFPFGFPLFFGITRGLDFDLSPNEGMIQVVTGSCYRGVRYVSRTLKGGA